MWCFRSPKPAASAKHEASKPASDASSLGRQASSDASSTVLVEREGPVTSSYASSSLITSLSSGQSWNDVPSYKEENKEVIRAQKPQRQVPAMRARFAAYSCPGFLINHPDKENQDAWVIKDLTYGKGALLFGVFDGHGENGGVLSQTLSKLLPEMLTQSESWKAEDYKGALSTQIPACAEAMRSYGMDLSLSGSTAVVAVLQSNSKLTVANLGDCRCFIGGVCKDGSCYSIPLSTDHTLAEAAEEQRVRASNGWVGRCMSEGKAVGPKRMYLPEKDIPGLALTRAIGDYVALNIGLSSEPDVVQYQVRPQDRYLVLCSDGMYEFMSNKKIISLIHTLAEAGCQPEHIAKFLVDKARQRWLRQDGRFVDDCSVLVVLLDRPRMGRTQSCRDPSGHKKASRVSDALMRTGSLPSASLLDSCTSHISAVHPGRPGRRVNSVSSLVPSLLRTASHDSDGHYREPESPGRTGGLSSLGSLRQDSFASSVGGFAESVCSFNGRSSRLHSRSSSRNFVPALMRTQAHEAHVQNLPPSIFLNTCDHHSMRRAAA